MGVTQKAGIALGLNYARMAGFRQVIWWNERSGQQWKRQGNNVDYKKDIALHQSRETYVTMVAGNEWAYETCRLAIRWKAQ